MVLAYLFSKPRLDIYAFSIGQMTHITLNDQIPTLPKQYIGDFKQTDLEELVHRSWVGVDLVPWLSVS